MKEISYAIGLSMASNLRSSGVEALDIEQFTKGIKAILQDEEIEMTPDQVNQMLNDYFGKLQKKAEANNSTV